MSEQISYTAENANLTPEVRRIFAASRAMLASLSSERRIATPDYKGSVEFARVFPEFFQAISVLIEPAVMEELDKVSRNGFWFLTMVCSTLAVAKSLPITAEDLKQAIALQRRLAHPDQRTQNLVARLVYGEFKRIRKDEYAEAFERCYTLLLVGESKEEIYIINPLFRA